MAINKNHEFEELNGVKCGIVEKNVSADRVAFLKKLLAYNNYEVIVVPSPLPKVTPAAAVVDGAEPIPTPIVVAPETFIIGVTDYSFNPVNAVFGRLLKTEDGHIVTLAYWKQQDIVSHDEVPYFGNKAG